MMKYLSPDFCRPANLSEVTPPAILLPLDRYDEPFVVLGLGAEAMVCFLGKNHQFHAFERDKATNFKGLAVEGVAFEVDLESAFSLDGAYAPPGSALREGSTLQLVVKGERNIYPRLGRAPLVSALPVASEGQKAGFLRWRAVLVVGEEKFEIWAASAEATKVEA